MGSRGRLAAFVCVLGVTVCLGALGCGTMEKAKPAPAGEAVEPTVPTAPGAPAVAVVRKCAAAPTIDGDLGDVCWKRARIAGVWIDPNVGGAAKPHPSLLKERQTGRGRDQPAARVVGGVLDSAFGPGGHGLPQRPDLDGELLPQPSRSGRASPLVRHRPGRAQLRGFRQAQNGVGADLCVCRATIGCIRMHRDAPTTGPVRGWVLPS